MVEDFVRFDIYMLGSATNYFRGVLLACEVSCDEDLFLMRSARCLRVRVEGNVDFENIRLY